MVFAAGRYAPDTEAGRSLLAHELAHVVQQRFIVDPRPEMAPEHDASERAAEQAAGGGEPTLAPLSANAPALQRQPAKTASPPAQQTGPRRPEISERDRREIAADVERIVAELRSSFFTDQWKIVGIILRWSERDRLYQEQTGYPGTDYVDAFLLETKRRAYSRSTAGAAWQERVGIVYDDVWHELAGERLRVWKDRVSKSRQGSDGPREGPPENFWKTLSKQEAIGLWGMLKGMGTTAAAGLVDAPARAIVKGLREKGVPVDDPASAAAWLAKQYDISGEAMFGKEFAEGDPLLLGMTAADIGTGGGAVIWQLIMLGKGKGSAAWASKALQYLGILGSLDGVQTSATALARIVKAKHTAGTKITVGELANDPEFRRECTNLVANVVATVSAIMGVGNAKPDAAAQATIKAWQAAGLVVNAVQVGERLGSCVQEGLGPATAAEKEKKIATLLGEALSAAIDVAAGVHEARQEAKAKALESGPPVKELPAPKGGEEVTKPPVPGEPPPGTPEPKVEVKPSPPQQVAQEPAAVSQAPEPAPLLKAAEHAATQPAAEGPALLGPKADEPTLPGPKAEEPTLPVPGGGEVVAPKPAEETAPAPKAAEEQPATQPDASKATADAALADLRRRIQQLRERHGQTAADKPALEQQLKRLEALGEKSPTAAKHHLDEFDRLMGERAEEGGGRKDDESADEASRAELEAEAREGGRLTVKQRLEPEVTTTQVLTAPDPITGEPRTYHAEQLVAPEQAARAAGNVEDTIGEFGGAPDRVSELQVETPDGRRVRPDFYEHGREIGSRKSGLTGQLAQIPFEEALGHLQEFALKYPEGATIAGTPSVPLHLRGQPLSGQRVLEVPPQESPVPEAVLAEAKKRNVVIRDKLGRVYE